MKNFLFGLMVISPLTLFAASGDVETDIIQRTVNFVIFAAILYYLLADKIKTAFSNRTLSIQSELDKVQDALLASRKKVDDANAKLEEAKSLATEIVSNANSEVDKIKENIFNTVNTDIENLQKHLNEKIRVETRKAKREIVLKTLNDLLCSNNIELSDEELSNIILKKVA